MPANDAKRGSSLASTSMTAALPSMSLVTITTSTRAMIPASTTAPISLAISPLNRFPSKPMTVYSSGPSVMVVSLDPLQSKSAESATRARGRLVLARGPPMIRRRIARVESDRGRHRRAEPCADRSYDDAMTATHRQVSRRSAIRLGHPARSAPSWRWARDHRRRHRRVPAGLANVIGVYWLLGALLTLRWARAHRQAPGERVAYGAAVAGIVASVVIFARGCCPSLLEEERMLALIGTFSVVDRPPAHLRASSGSPSPRSSVARRPETIAMGILEIALGIVLIFSVELRARSRPDPRELGHRRRLHHADRRDPSSARDPACALAPSGRRRRG